MTPLFINEVFQWLALAAVLLIVLAVYRQLGLMVTGAPESQAHAFGPLIGKEPGDQLLSLFPQNMASWRVIIFVREECSSCEDLIHQTPAWRDDESVAPFSLALVVDGSAAYRRHLQAEFGALRTESVDDFLDGGKRLYGRTLPAYPFSIVISPANKVVHKQVGSDGDAIRERLLRLQELELAVGAQI